MAEIAPLTSAHAHARKAAKEFGEAHRKESSQEHQHAADDFSRAARSTGDPEALRILKLLEDQHRRLASILQKDDAVPAERTDDANSSASSSGAKGSEAAATKVASPAGATMSKTKAPSIKTTSRIGSQLRESSPSLARDIASRRGIPPPGRGTPSTTVHARARQLSPESTRKRVPDPGAAPKIPPSIVDSQANLREARKAKKAEDDEGFAKFYNVVTSGAMSKISSALTYAGLPLTADDIKPEQPSQKRTVSASNDPDVNKYFSKAALDAVEYQHRQKGTFGHGFGPGESFYVVQTGGGTYSYADITKNKQAYLSGIDEDDEDSFVDAREIPGPSSPKHSRAPPRRRDTFGKTKTAEEIELENTTLKSTIDYLSSRLSHFEAHAQDASMAALTQSMIQARPSQEAVDPAMQERIRQLEQQVEKQAEVQQQLEEKNVNLTKTVKKYRSRWDSIKTSAMEKDKAKKDKAERATGEGGDDTPVAVPDIS